jgi:hypothetical protein
MSIFTYALMAYGLLAVISLAVVGIIVGVSKVTGGKTAAEEGDQ